MLSILFALQRRLGMLCVECSHVECSHVVLPSDPLLGNCLVYQSQLFFGFLGKFFDPLGACQLARCIFFVLASFLVFNGEHVAIANALAGMRARPCHNFVYQCLSRRFTQFHVLSRPSPIGGNMWEPQIIPDPSFVLLKR